MANPIQAYRGVRTKFRQEVPYWLRAYLKSIPQIGGAVNAEHAVGMLIPNEYRTPSQPQQAPQGQPNYNITVNQDGTTNNDTTSQTGGQTYTPEQLAAAQEKYNRDLAALERQRDAQLLSYQDMLTDLDKNETELGKQRDAGITDNTGYFNRVSPDAYQSQTQVYNNKVLDAYNEGLNTVKRNKERIGQAKTNYLADYQDTLWNLENQFNSDTGAYTEQNPTLNPRTVTQDAVNPMAPRMFSTGSNVTNVAAGMNAPYRTKEPQYDPWGFIDMKQPEDPSNQNNWDWMK